MADTNEDPNRPGYTTGGLWIGALSRCAAHGTITPCDQCNYWIGAGY